MPKLRNSTPLKEVEKGAVPGVKETYADAEDTNSAGAQILGVATLEFGVIFHSVTIGLTLALTEGDGFTTLFVVIIFHQMFVGLGLGTRLAFLNLPENCNWAPINGGIAYASVTPIEMAIELGARSNISMSSGNASVASGVLDAMFAGILLYTATVELIAHEFIFNRCYHTCSWKKLSFVIVSFALDAGIMALFGEWA